jgi:hypothetical protein
MLFAGLAVLTRELPECVALADDVSNDGNVAAFLQEELVRKVSLSGAGSTEFFAFALRRLRLAARAPRLQGEARFSSRPARILLSLFQVQRK